MMDCTSYEWAVLVFAAVCIGMSKTGVQGITLLAVPYMAMAFGAKESTGIILPMLCMADIIAVAYYRRMADWKVVARLLPTAVVGFFVAIAVDDLMPRGQFRQLMGWTLMLGLVVMVWNEVTAWRRARRQAAQADGQVQPVTPWGQGRWWYSAIFGLLGGFTTMIGNAAGPVMSVYLLSMRKEKMAYIGINAWFFLVVNLLKVPLQMFVWHNITGSTLTLNVMMLPAIGVGAWLGIRLVRMFPEKAFRRFIQVVTILSVLLLIVN